MTINCKGYIEKSEVGNLEPELKKLCRRPLEDEIDVKEVIKVYKSIKLGKAGSIDEFEPEHFRYAGPKTMMLLTDLFNGNVSEDMEWRPPSIRKLFQFLDQTRTRQ